MTAISMSSVRYETASDRLKPVRIWLWLVAALVFVMVMVGGATRLTGSGLSITEWRPVSGAIPPLGEVAWQEAFAKYQASPQYELLNKGLAIDDFKVLYWWEWGHRQLGRFIGLFYIAGLGFLLLTRRVNTRTGTALIGLGLLLGLQGAVGWIMVASGLKPGMIAVEPVKLALHLTLASLFFAGVVWTATRLARHRTTFISAQAAAQGSVIVALVLLQIALGGLVAGSHAGLTYNTWPLMDGALVPSQEVLFSITPWFENFVDNPTLVQFDHRVTAYLILSVTIWHAVSIGATAGPASRRAWVIVGLVLAQAGLGITTLLLVVPLWAALAHQAFAILVLGMATAHAAAMMRDRAEAQTAVT